MGAEKVYSFHLEDAANASQAGSLRLHGLRSWTCASPKNGTMPSASGLPPGSCHPLWVCSRGQSLQLTSMCVALQLHRDRLALQRRILRLHQSALEGLRETCWSS